MNTVNPFKPIKNPDDDPTTTATEDIDTRTTGETSDDRQGRVSDSSQDEGEGFEPCYGSVDEWLIDWLLPIAAPRASASNRTHWCSQWYKHPDVVTRLTAAWLAWEHANYDPEESDDSVLGSLGNRSHWWVHHWAHHEPRIFGSESSMTSCKNGHRKLDPSLPADRLPNLRVVS